MLDWLADVVDMRLCAPIQPSVTKSGSVRTRTIDHKVVIWRGVRNHDLEREDGHPTEKHYPAKLPTRLPRRKALFARRRCLLEPGKGTNMGIDSKLAIYWFRSVNRHAKARSPDTTGVYPTYSLIGVGPSEVDYGTVYVSPTAAEWRDVPLTDLGNPPLDDFGARMRAANTYAVNNGFRGGFPNFEHADYGHGIVCGTILIKNDVSEFRDIPLVNAGGDLNDIGARFTAVHEYAKLQGFVSGFPTMFDGDYGHGTVCGAVLLRTGVEWFDQKHYQAAGGIGFTG